jgi:hypothetical protein
MERANGDPLSLEEIGGYEIRYRKISDSAFETIVISNAAIEQYFIDELPAGEYEFKVATFDSDGIYSDFVTAQ